jgi:Na+-driven multidrug efflux pump
MAGIALATTLGQVLSTILALYYLLKKYKSVTLKKQYFKVKLNVVLSIFALGSSIFTTHILAIIAQIIQMNSLRIYGGLSIYGSEVVIASSGAIAKLSIVFLSSIIGIAIGCQPILGFNLGSKKYDRVKETYLLALRYGTTVAVAAFLILQLFPSQLLSIFGSDNPLFYEFATKYIRIYMALLFLNALQPVTSTFCTAIGKANLGFWMAFIRQGILMIPLLLILPNFFGLNGVLLAGSISDGIAAMVVIYIGTRQIKRLTTLQAEKDKCI